MSTRSQRRFGRPDRDDATGVARICNRSDGDPSAVVHLPVELTDPLDESQTLLGPDYAAA